MNPSLITRPLECVPRTPWCILPLGFTALECIYLYIHAHAAHIRQLFLEQF